MASTEGTEILDRESLSRRADADADAGADADQASPSSRGVRASQAPNTARRRRRTLDSQQQDAAISRDSHATGANEQIDLHEGNDLHEGKHHDEHLWPYQRLLINAITPSLLVNVPHPWRAFLCLIFLHLLLLCGTTWYVFTHCPTIAKYPLDTIFFRQWKELLVSGIPGPDKHVMYSVTTELVEDRVSV